MASPPTFVALSGGRAIACLLVGMAFGVLVDLYRGHLSATRGRGAMLAVEDGLFWLAATVLVSVGLYFANWLEIRLYSVTAMALGALLAMWLAGPVVRPVSAWATRGGQAVLYAALWPMRKVAQAWGRRPKRPPRKPRTPPPPPEAPTRSDAPPEGRRVPRPWWLGGTPSAH